MSLNELSAVPLDEIFTVQSSRQVGLLLRGVGLALAATALALLVGSALAGGLLCGGALAVLTLVVGAATLLTPPYIFAYAWSLLVWPGGLPVGGAAGSVGLFSTFGRAALCLGLWLAPVAALPLAVGWRAGGEALYQLTRCDAGPLTSCWLAARSALPAWVALSLAAAFPLALTEFTVPHLCLVQTWNTEILALVQLSERPGSAAALGWPLLVIAAVGATAALWLLRSVYPRAVDWETAEIGGKQPGAAWLAGLIGLLLLATPTLLLLANLRDPSGFLRSWRVFPEAARGAAVTLVGVSLAAGVVATAVAALLSRGGWSAWLGICMAIVIGLIGCTPPILVGDALLAAYLRVQFIIDTHTILILCGVARFAWIPLVLLLGALAGRREAAKLAATDGAGWAATFVRVRLRAVRSWLAAGALAAGLLAASEAAASQLVTPPGAGNLGLTLLNQMHFGRSDEVLAICLQFVALLVMTSVALRWLLIPRGERRLSRFPKR